MTKLQELTLKEVTTTNGGCQFGDCGGHPTISIGSGAEKFDKNLGWIGSGPGGQDVEPVFFG